MPVMHVQKQQYWKLLITFLSDAFPSSDEVSSPSSEPLISVHLIKQPIKNDINNKLASYGTDGPLFTTDVSQLQSHVTQKLGQISQIWPNQI